MGDTPLVVYLRTLQLTRNAENKSDQNFKSVRTSNAKQPTNCYRTPPVRAFKNYVKRFTEIRRTWPSCGSNVPENRTARQTLTDEPTLHLSKNCETIYGIQ